MGMTKRGVAVGHARQCRVRRPLFPLPQSRHCFFCLKAEAGCRYLSSVAESRAQVKGLMSLDLPDGQSLPEDPERCCVQMQADIGPAEENGAEIFDFTVCTPSGLGDRLAKDARPFWARGILMVERFDWDDVEKALNQFVHSVSGEDWRHVASKLNRFTLWEFEDYLDFDRE